jgi:predicted transcriptional regulator of viral defense system
MTRFCVSPPSPFQLAASLRKNGYLSHGTAAYLHGLIKAPQQAIYINVEQSAKPAVEKSLSQAGIDRAFAGKQRQSQYSFSNEDLTVTILAGKNTGRTGVEMIAQPEGEPVLATNLERTLVDLAVRPAYAGGISNVLEAYRAARSRTSAEALTLLLDRVGRVYPYAQSIGFLMRQAGYPAEDLGLLRKRITEFKFYLSHDLQDPAYDADWRLFHPWK